MDDRCPGVLRLHAAADGHLLRIRLPGGHLTAEGLAAIAGLAELGNGLIELTSRASAQVRGLDARDADRAAYCLTNAGLLPSPTHDRVRNVLADPLGGRAAGSLLLTDGLVRAIDRALCQDPELAGLPGRFLFAVEDGSQVIGGGQADVALLAEAGGDAGVRLRLCLAGRPTALTAQPEAAADLAVEAAHAFLTVLERFPAAHGEAIWRIADLPDACFDRLLDQLRTALLPCPRLGRGRPSRPGRLRQADGGNALTALVPLGRLQIEIAHGLAALAVSSRGGVRISPWRTVALVDVPDSRLSKVAVRLSELGLVLDDASGWTGLSACAGLGACARARIDVRAAAGRRAAIRGVTGAGTVEHWSACERRCGRPPVFAQAVTATPVGVEVEAAAGARRVDSVDDALALLAASARESGTAVAEETASAADAARATQRDRAIALAAGGSRR